jgi:hypothetical protein
VTAQTPATPEPTAAERLAQIRAREQAATKGPWRVEEHRPSLTRMVVSEDGTLDVDLGYVGNRTEPDAEFIARAREDIPWLLGQLEELLEELGGRDEEARERWIAKQLAETGLRSMDFRNGMAMDIEPARDMVAHWVGAARAMLGDAPNYSETPVEMEVKVGESPERFAFILQRVGKLTPHQARQKAERERDEARGQLAAVLAECDAIETEARGQHDKDGGMREAVRRIRTAARRDCRE